MKFVPRTPRDGINVSREHPLKEAATVIVGVSVGIALLVVFLVLFVDLVILLVPARTEARVFVSWAREGPVLEDSRADEVARVEALLGRLADHWPDAPYAFRVEIADDREPNAIALPGGLIVITAGLLDQVESENELAFVLGHELGHFRHRDHLRRLGRGIALKLLLTVLRRDEGALQLGGAVSDLTVRGFSRAQENRADRFGLELVEAEYGHVAESWRFFERATGEDAGLDAFVAYLSTHPAAAERIGELRGEARERGWPLQGPTTPWRER